MPYTIIRIKDFGMFLEAVNLTDAAEIACKVRTKFNCNPAIISHSSRFPIGVFVFDLDVQEAKTVVN